MREEYVEAVLELVGMIPAGNALAYGDVAELLESGGARQVGAVMGRYGSAVPWWRVLKSNGDAPPGHERAALLQYLKEGTPLHGRHLEYLRTGEGRWRVDMGTARWAPDEDELDRIGAVAGRLGRALRELSAPDDEMTV